MISSMAEEVQRLKQMRAIVLHTWDGRTLQAAFNGTFWELLPKDLGIEEAIRVLYLSRRLNYCELTEQATNLTTCRLQHAALRSTRSPPRHPKTT